MKQDLDYQTRRNLIRSLVLQKKIKTTGVRAKMISGQVDRLVNKLKKGTLAGRREVLNILPEKKIVERFLKEILPKLGSRRSGYTKIVKIGRRLGDGAEMVMIEWMEDEKTEVGSEKLEVGTKKQEDRNEKLEITAKINKGRKDVKANKNK